MINPNVEERLDTIVKKLNEIKTARSEFLPTFFSDNVEDKTKLPSNKVKWTEFIAPYTIFDTEKYFWFKASFDINAKENERAYLSIDTHIINAASTIRPQGLLYLNGNLIQGIDINHKEVLLKNGKYEMYLLFYTHTFDKCFPLDFSIKYVDSIIESFAYDLSVPLSASKLLLKNTNDYVKSISVLEKTLNLIDLRMPYSKEFYSSIENAKEYLYKNYYNGICGSDITVDCVGQTHIDVAWLWNLDQTKQKVERSFSTVLKLMDEYPEYKFMSTQPQLFAFLKERNPKLYERVKEKVLEGRWEVDGSMWLEADCNLTSGESLVRQIMHGKRFFKEEFNKDCKNIWIPDVFGYSGAMPQIMVKSGLKNFITAKIGWNDTNRFPYDFFTWKGIDGSEVFAYLLSTCEANPRKGVYDTTYTFYCAPLTPEYVLSTWNRFTQKEFTDSVILSYGWGDGGGGPTREDLENQKRLSYGLPGLPKTKIVTLDKAITKIKANYDKSTKEIRRIPTWNGELYFEYHRGTLTSVPKIKMHNRKGEFALINTELLGTISNKLLDAEYPTKMLDKDWKLLLLNQFHDILPGSAMEDVYKDSDEQFNTIFNDCNKNINNSLSVLANNVKAQDGYLVFNPNGNLENGVVAIDGVTKIVKDVSSFGYKVVNFADTKSNVKIGKLTLENSYYKIQFNKDGSISSLFDKRNNREVVKTNGSLNRMVAFEDMPYQYHNWEMAPYHKQNSWGLLENATFTKIIDGDRAGFVITKKYDKSTITQKVFLYNDGIERIDFITDVDWQEKDQLLKTLFDFNLLVDTAKYDIQFGSIDRSTHDNTSWNSACFESVGQKWVDMSEHNFGVALLNDGKYGFGTENSTLSMTMVKSGGFPYEDASKEIPTFTYSLLPHKDGYENGKVIENANLLNRPFFVEKVKKHKNVTLENEYSFITCETQGVVIETIKQAENGDGVVVRMFEAHKEHKQVSINLNFNFNKVYISDLMENNLHELKAKDNNVKFDIKPFEIITLYIK